MDPAGRPFHTHNRHISVGEGLQNQPSGFGDPKPPFEGRRSKPGNSSLNLGKGLLPTLVGNAVSQIGPAPDVQRKQGLSTVGITQTLLRSPAKTCKFGRSVRAIPVCRFRENGLAKCNTNRVY